MFDPRPNLRRRNQSRLLHQLAHLAAVALAILALGSLAVDVPGVGARQETNAHNLALARVGRLPNLWYVHLLFPLCSSMSNIAAVPKL